MKELIAFSLLIGGGYLIYKNFIGEIAPNDNSIKDGRENVPTLLNPDYKPDLEPSLIDTVKDEIMSLWTAPKRAAPYLDLIAQTEIANDIPTNMLARLLHQESSFLPAIISGQKRSSVGAMGIAQFMPATAKELGIDPLNPQQAIPAAGRYLKSLYNSLGSWDKALAAYNWGIGNVKRKGLTKAPKETQNYFTSILTDLGL